VFGEQGYHPRGRKWTLRGVCKRQCWALLASARLRLATPSRGKIASKPRKRVAEF
jgi:hypothetical protein